MGRRYEIEASGTMNTIFNSSDYESVRERIGKLSPDTKPLWGKMNSAQMLVHCSQAARVVVGDLRLKRLFIGYIFGPFAKKDFVNEKPFKQGYPTAKEFVSSGQYDFGKEKECLLGLLKRMYEGGPEKATKEPHAFFGHLTSEEWGITQWKHLDHHLRQFGC